MTRYIIILLLIVIIVLTSFLYKEKIVSLYDGFPAADNPEHMDGEAPLYLYFFFSRSNCPPCLKVIDLLNRLQSPFRVFGVVPEEELKEAAVVRQATGAVFPLIGRGNFSGYIPPYTPALVGVSGSGTILFVLPAVSRPIENLEEYLHSFYSHLYPALIQKRD